MVRGRDPQVLELRRRVQHLELAHQTLANIRWHASRSRAAEPIRLDVTVREPHTAILALYASICEGSLEDRFVGNVQMRNLAGRRWQI
tara:strand:+ start:239 stop:502 length:264 start_codon:yes stop_codon:yes gene_type:complete